VSTKLEQALELIRDDRPESVDRALALLQNTVYSFSMKVCGHPEDAEDTMQEVLVKLLPYLPKFESPKALSVWLYKVARNRCLMNRRGEKNSRGRHVSLDELMPSQYELSELLESGDPSPEDDVLRGESNRRLREAVLKVPPLYRMVLVLHDMEGLSTAEVAETTGLKEGTVRVRLHRARLMLRQHLSRMAKTKGEVVQIHAAAEELPKRPRRCREMFASLSDYMDGMVEDSRCRDMEQHLHDCEPCVAFLDSLKSAVQQCRTYEPGCDGERAAVLRRDLVRKYRAAVAALPKASKKAPARAAQAKV
jgi:RNA polymerase sigma-70 factor (ECF subfamily)